MWNYWISWYRLHQDCHAISMVFCSGILQSQLAKTDLATVCWFLELHETKFLPGKAANRPVEHVSLRHLDQAASTNVYELQQLATTTLQYSNLFRWWKGSFLAQLGNFSEVNIGWLLNNIRHPNMVQQQLHTRQDSSSSIRDSSRDPSFKLPCESIGLSTSGGVHQP